MPCTSIKIQVLADLVTEFAESPLEEEVGKYDMDGKSIGMVSLQEPYPGGYTLMVQQIKEDLEWD